MSDITVVTPTGCLGIRGINQAAFEQAMTFEPDAIAMDAGSIDPGPYYLGAGAPHTPRSVVKWDLGLTVSAGKDRGVPVIVGTTGGNGARPHIVWALEILEEVAEEENLDLDVTIIGSDLDPDELERLRTNREITPVGHDDELTDDDVDDSDEIVAQMGVEAITRALDDEPDVIFAGRACDNAVIGAYPIYAGLPKGLSLHMGNILECAELAAEVKPGKSIDTEGKARMPMVGQITEEEFTIRPSDDRMQCTEVSIAGHSLYEEGNPFRSQEPGGVLDTSESTYESVDDETVRVTGSRFVEDDKYTVKLEGAGGVGYRSISITGVRDPLMIEQIEEITNGIEETASKAFSDIDFDLIFHIYGKNGSMGDLEPRNVPEGHELGVVLEVVSDSQENAHEVCEDAAHRFAFWRYENRVTTAGNTAYLFSPNVMDEGEVIDLTIYHAVPIGEPTEPFTYDNIELPADAGEWR